MSKTISLLVILCFLLGVVPVGYADTDEMADAPVAADMDQITDEDFAAKGDMIDETAGAEMDDAEMNADAAPEEILGAVAAPGVESGGYVSMVDGGKEYFRQLIQQYSAGEEEFTDPQVITDEEFFGKYDAASGVWTIESLINYEKFSALSPVADAVMAGDYELAKEHYHAYYKEKFSNTTLGASGTKEQAVIDSAKLYAENFNINKDAGYISTIKLTDEFETHQVNVTSAVNAVKNSSAGRMSIGLAALKKDGYQGVFYSKESLSGGAVLEVTVNGGRKMTFEPIADATVAAGRNADTNYGGEIDIVTEESRSTIGLPIDEDSYTKQGFLLFDLSEISRDNTIDNAVLSITGKMVESDNPVGIEETRDFKDVLVLSSKHILWTDQSLTWNTAEKLGVSYDGDYSFVTLFNNPEAYNSCMRAYLGTGEEAYAYNAVRILTSTIADWFVKDSINGANTLALSAQVYDFPNTVAEMSRNPFMTAEKFALLMKGIYATSQRAVDQWSNSEETNNWGTSDATAVMISALTYPEFRVVDEPLIDGGYGNGKLGGWKAVGEHRLAYTLDKFLFPDGSCIEVSVSYTKYILNTTGVRLFNIIKGLGLDARECISEEVLELLEKYLLYLMNVSTPIAKGGGWQQGQGSAYTETAFQLYTELVNVLNNPYFNWMHSGRTQGEAPDYLSVAYDAGQKAVLRADWNTQGVSAQINADGGQTSHGQSDDLGFNLFAHGSYLLVDSLQNSYDTANPVSAWLHSTRAHNAVEIDGVSQNGFVGHDIDVEMPDGTQQTVKGLSGGVLGSLHPENREYNKIYNYIKAETYNYNNNSYLSDDFINWRDVLFIEPEYFIITDFVKPKNDPDAVHTYSQNWHTMPNSGLSLLPDSLNAKTRFTSSANVLIAPVEQSVPLESKILNGWYTNNTLSAPYVSYEKQSRGISTFNTVIYPMKRGEDADISTQNLNMDVPESVANAFQFTIDNGTESAKSVSYYTLFDEKHKAERRFGMYETDASLALISKKAGRPDLAIIRDGSSITDKETGQIIVGSEFPIPDLGVRWSGSTLELETSKSVSLDEETTAVYENAAAGKNGESSTHFSSSAPEYAFDADMTTAWRGVYTGETEEYPWIMVDMEEELKPFIITVTDNQEDVRYQVLYSADGKSWTETEIETQTATVGNTDGLYRKQIVVKPAACRFVKLVLDTYININIHEIEIDTSMNEVMLKGLRLYAPDKVSAVYVNGKQVDFYQDAGFVLFDEDKTGETEPPDEEEEEKPSGGSGGSGGSHGAGGSARPGGGGGTGTPSIPSVTPDPPKEEKPYENELSGHWGRTEIESLLEKGIVQGTGESLNLGGEVTRAELSALLVRAMELETVAFTDEFEDVSSDDWYADDIATAFAAGIMEGSGDGRADPMRTATREQMAKMLVSVYQMAQPDTPADTAGASEYTDGADISGWAKEYVEAAAALGLMQGMDTGEFRPLDTVRREQAFVAVYRLMTKTKQG